MFWPNKDVEANSDELSRSELNEFVFSGEILLQVHSPLLLILSAMRKSQEIQLKLTRNLYYIKYIAGVAARGHEARPLFEPGLGMEFVHL